MVQDYTMKKPQLINDFIYHIFNRGVEKRKTFLEKGDFVRFIRDLYEFNDEDAVINLSYHFNPKTIEVEPRYIKKEQKKRKLLVDILAFVLMPNHFHLILRQLKENGISRFMQKLGTGYTMYFNKKNDRVGSLFQGRYKAVMVKEEPHFIFLPSYIHLNPIKLYRGSTSINSMLRFLEDYKWSSLPDYLGKKNFPSVTSRDFFSDYFGGKGAYHSEIKDLLKGKMKRYLPVIDEVKLDADF